MAASELIVKIYDDNAWAGTGRIPAGQTRIEDCAANLGDDVYDAIEDAILDGETEGEVGEYSWTAEAVQS